MKVILLNFIIKLSITKETGSRKEIIEQLEREIKISYTEKDKLLLINVVLGIYAYLGVCETKNSSECLTQENERNYETTCEENLDEKT